MAKLTEQQAHIINEAATRMMRQLGKQATEYGIHAVDDLSDKIADAMWAEISKAPNRAIGYYAMAKVIALMCREAQADTDVPPVITMHMIQLVVGGFISTQDIKLMAEAAQETKQ